MKPDIVYDGTTLSWQGHGTFKATSGLPEHQKADEQTVKDAGPIPEGLYSFPLIIAKDATMTSPGQLDTREGIEALPDEWTFKGKTYKNAAWGPDRVRLSPVSIVNKKARARGGFYLHDSTKGYSHGCIETQNLFFLRLREYARLPAAKRGNRKRLYVKVKYPAVDASTYGGTKTGP